MQDDTGHVTHVVRMNVIYTITNVVNGNFYVGSTKDHTVRFQVHRRHLRRGNHHCEHLQNAWNKYGEDVFKFRVVLSIFPGVDRFAVEQEWLDEHVGEPYCYNTSGIAEGANYWLGKERDEATRKKIGDTQRGVAKGTPNITAEERQRRSDCARANAAYTGAGRVWSVTSRKKLSDAIRAVYAAGAEPSRYWLGKERDEATRKKIGDAQRGQVRGPRPEDVKQKISAAKQGVPAPQSTLAAMRKEAVAVAPDGAEHYYVSLTDLCNALGLQRGSILRAMEQEGGALKRGPYKGWSFRYTEEAAKKGKRVKTTMTTAQFVDAARAVHGDRYGYERAEFVSTHTKVEIVCREHGAFFQLPAQHCDGRGCAKCGFAVSAARRSMTTEQFVEQARERHGDRYDYSQTQYVTAREKVVVICRAHGPFEVVPHAHVGAGSGCARCAREKRSPHPRGLTP